MNSIRQTQALNKRELENAVPPSASWHADYRDTAYIYVGGLPFDVSEGDIVTIFSQFGRPTHVNLIRDKETGKSKGFGFVKYEDQRSCDLAVDNLGGANVLGRVLRVDHTRYKKREDEDEEVFRVDGRDEEEVEREGRGNRNGKRGSDEDEDDEGEGEGRKSKKRRKPTSLIREERELEEMLQIKDGEEEDPMREYLIKEKREEVNRALAMAAQKKHERRHKHHHRHRRDGGDGQDEDGDMTKSSSSRRHGTEVQGDEDQDRKSSHRRPNRDDDERPRREDGSGSHRTHHHRQHRTTDQRSRSRERNGKARSKNDSDNYSIHPSRRTPPLERPRSRDRDDRRPRPRI